MWGWAGDLYLVFSLHLLLVVSETYNAQRLWAWVWQWQFGEWVQGVLEQCFCMAIGLCYAIVGFIAGGVGNWYIWSVVFCIWHLMWCCELSCVRVGICSHKRLLLVCFLANEIFSLISLLRQLSFRALWHEQPFFCERLRSYGRIMNLLLKRPINKW